MKVCSISFFIFYFILSFSVKAQDTELPFNKVGHKDLDLKDYPADTSASAVVLDEQGHSFLDIEKGGDLIFEYYVKIKILNKNGLDEANFEIPLLKGDKYKDKFDWLKASTYNDEGGRIKETAIDTRKIFTENSDGYDLVKFTLPDVHPGSVIEVKYKTESPFVRSFHRWEFQSNLPKLRSEYTAKIPANYTYNISLRGSLKLTVNESSALRDCFVGDDGSKSSCSILHYGMVNIPAFKAEQYMTARKNFISALNFELTSIIDLTGKTKKFTEDWADVDLDLSRNPDFGEQIKKAKNVLADSVARVTAGETDELKKAKSIYRFVTSYYTWNEGLGKYADLGVKKAYETRGGNSGDINLSLVGALQQAGLNAFPVILSTRENGIAVELYPVVTEFNYVIAAVDVGGTRYLLDGTSELLPFGVLPLRSLNGRGRLIGKESSFIDLKPGQKYKTVTSVELTLGEDGHADGTVTVTSQGYDALVKRSKILTAQKREDYIASLSKEWDHTAISKYDVDNLAVIEKPVVEKASISVEPSSASGGGTIYFDPFFLNRDDKNPFQTEDRQYPVDYGAPVEQMYVLSLTFPPSLQIDELPKSVGLALPQGGGKFTFSATQAGNKLSVISNQVFTKPVYDANEYHFLRELYSRILQVQQSQIVFKRK